MVRKRIMGLGVASMLAAALVVGGALSERTATVTAQGATERLPSSTSTPDGDEQLAASLITNFAVRLDIDEATLNAAFTAAVSDTVDGAVESGQLTEEQAAEIKVKAQGGLRSLLLAKEQEQPKEKRDITHPEGDQAWQAAWIAAGEMLALGAREIKMELGSGKSLADIAREHGVDAQQLQDRMLAAGKAVLDAAVGDGTLPLGAAEEEYRRLTDQVVGLISGAGVSGAKDQYQDTMDTK